MLFVKFHILHIQDFIHGSSCTGLILSYPQFKLSIVLYIVYMYMILFFYRAGTSRMNHFVISLRGMSRRGERQELAVKAREELLSQTLLTGTA